MWNMEAMEAEGALAAKAVEMNVLVVKRALVVALADLVFRHARTVFDGMNEVIGQEQGQRSEDGRAVNRVQFIIQLAQRQRTTVIGQGAIDEQARGSGFYTSTFEERRIVFGFHVFVSC